MEIVCFLILALALGSVEVNCRSQSPSCWDSGLKFSFPIDVCYGVGVCRCDNFTADCSSNPDSLTFIPDLNRSYKYLNFSNNNVTSISDVSFFVNVSRDVEIIDLHSNGLTNIAEGVFHGLDNLTTLLLGGSNQFGYKAMPALLSVPSLMSVRMRCLNLGPIPQYTFQGAYASQLRYIDLSWNHLGSMNMSVLQPLQNLTNITLWQNEIYDLQTAYIPSLSKLDLSVNRLYDFPKTCSNKGDSSSLFPNLKHISLDKNMIQCIDDPVCLPNVRVIWLKYNHFEHFRNGTFRAERFPALHELEIMQMENKIIGMEPFFINNSAVERVNFVLNNVDFSKKYVHPDMFGGCTNVNYLNLRGNSFQDVSVKKFHHMMRPMEHSLRILSLSGTGLTQIPRNMFSRLRHVTELYLYKNRFMSIPDGAFDNMHRLWKVILDNNLIQTISETTFSEKIRSSLKKVSLGGNPYQCDCNILWFQKWMRTNPVIFQDYHFRGYNCHNDYTVSIEDFVLNPQACILGSGAATLTIGIACFLIIFLVLLIVFFRFRWHVRLWLYEVCRGRRRRSRVSRGCKYDVFVSYAEEDAVWVQEELLPVLEGEWGLTLCVHHRDFRPGKHIVDNISDCVSDSERVILVFSPHFARSEWCQFELKYCQSFVMERDDVMVLVALQETQSRDMTGAMLAVLRTTTYIEWDDEQDARQSFWGRLHVALDDPEEIQVV
ncbi:toll-like receptor 2 isoform X1 [Littorina saxatilis]|uniref:toll-like receptor 2 isoform X1 n=1 Tax=Littorina saxatilis TaxID=31220 RepID=UPI0038B5A782